MFVAVPTELALSILPLLALTTEASAAKESFIQGAHLIGDAYQPCLATSGNACRGQRPHVGTNDVSLLVGQREIPCCSLLGDDRMIHRMSLIGVPVPIVTVVVMKKRCSDQRFFIRAHMEGVVDGKAQPSYAHAVLVGAYGAVLAKPLHFLNALVVARSGKQLVEALFARFFSATLLY